MFGKNLKYLRTKNAMSQHDLSKKINYNQTTITRWENNERKPTMKAIVTIAKDAKEMTYLEKGGKVKKIDKKYKTSIEAFGA